MKKIVLFLITSILFTVVLLSVKNSYSAYTKNVQTSLEVTTPKLEAVFLPGNEFNTKIKQISGDNNPAYNTDNTSITSIVRSNVLNVTPTIDNVVSTSDSSFPIYAWFSSGVLYYYTEVEHPYMNENSNGMFRNLLNLSSIDISTIDTSMVIGMNSMFWHDSSIVSLDLSTFNTSNVTIMGAMFEHCTNLKNIDLSSFNTSKVEQFTNMFRYMSEIENLDLSSFNMSAATDTSRMIDGLTKIKEFKTPKNYPNDTSVILTLPKTLYDENIVEYTTLGKSTNPVSPTETLIKEGYTVTFDANEGSVNPTSKVLTYENTTYGNLPTPTRTGYQFLGWSTNSNSGLPSGYQRLEYLESVQGQYIDTGLKANIGYLAELDGSYVEFIHNSPIYGAWTDGYTYWMGSSNSSYLVSSGNDNETYWGLKTFDTNRHIFSIRNDGTYIDNELLNSNVLFNYPYEHPIYVFASSAGGSFASWYSGKFRLYNLIMKSRDNTVVRNFVPVLNPSGEAGLYDLINNTFYGNLGEGSFVQGYITSSSKLEKLENHTLYAVWKDNVDPSLSLSKITYKEGFDGWTFGNAYVDSNGVLNMQDGGSASSPYYKVNGGEWYATWDGYVTQTNQYYCSPGGSIGSSTSYFDDNYNNVVSTNGYTGNGYASTNYCLTLNEWSPDSWNGWAGFGTTYLVYNFGNYYSSDISKVRNFKLWGEALTNSFYLINVTSSDNVGVVETKYAKGSQNKEYFKNNGTIVNNNQIRVLENGTYTVFVRDIVGNSTVQTIQIDKISYVGTYGMSIPTDINKIYFTLDGSTIGTMVKVPHDYDAGNFSSDSVSLGKWDSLEINSFQDVSTSVNGSVTQKDFGNTKVVVAGNNKFSVSQSIKNNWMMVRFFAGYGSNYQEINNLKLKFSNESSYTVKQAVDNNLIEPLVIYISFADGYNHVLGSFDNLINGNLTTGTWFISMLYLKVKNVYELTEISFDSTTAWDSRNDGINIYKLPSTADISLSNF